jgi:hypothetical protein
MAPDFLPTLGLPERRISACVGASPASASPALPGAPLAPRHQGTVDHGTEPLAGRRTAGARRACHRWRDEVPAARVPHGKSLAIEDRIPFTLRLGFDGWQRVEDRRAARTPFGLWSVVLAQQELALTRELNFTRRHESGWEGIDYRIELGSASAVALPQVLDDLPTRNAA